jgi:hypothetical protein
MNTTSWPAFPPIERLCKSHDVLQLLRTKPTANRGLSDPAALARFERKLRFVQS